MKRRVILRPRIAGFATACVCVALWNSSPAQAGVDANGMATPEAEAPAEANNWIELTLGATPTTGDNAQFEQNHHAVGDEVWGGIKDLHLEGSLSKDVDYLLDGHAIFDTNDYGIKLQLTKKDLGYIQVGYDEYRTWYDGNAGFFPPNGQFFTPFFP